MRTAFAKSCELALLVAGLALTSMGAETPSSVQLLTDGKLVPSAVYRWTGKPIEVVTDFGEEREIGGVRIMSGRSWVNCCVRKASFYAMDGQDARSPMVLAEHVGFGPANTFKEVWTSWKPVT